MKNNLIISMLLFLCCVSATAQKKLFNQALEAGRPKAGLYLMKNTKHKFLSIKSVREYAESNNLYLGAMHHVPVPRFGKAEHNVEEVYFLPESELPQYMFENVYPSGNFANMKEKGKAFISYTHPYSLTLTNDVMWSGEVDADGFITGSGYGFDYKYGRKCQSFTGRFNHGYPEGNVVFTKNEGAEFPFRADKCTKEYFAFGPVSNGAQWFKKGNGLYGFIDERGENIIKPRFDKVKSFDENGLAWVLKSPISFEIDKSGSLVKVVSDVNNRFGWKDAYEFYKDHKKNKDEYFSHVLEDYFIEYAKDADESVFFQIIDKLPHLIPRMSDLREEVSSHQLLIVNTLNGYKKWSSDKERCEDWLKTYVVYARDILKRNDEYLCKPKDKDINDLYSAMANLRRVPVLSERVSRYETESFLAGLLTGNTVQVGYVFKPYYGGIDESIIEYCKNNNIEGFSNVKKYLDLIQGLALVSRISGIHLEVLSASEKEFMHFDNNEISERINDAIAAAKEFAVKDSEIAPACIRAEKYLTERKNEIDKKCEIAAAKWGGVRKSRAEAYKKQRAIDCENCKINGSLTTLPKGWNEGYSSWFFGNKPAQSEKAGKIVLKNNSYVSWKYIEDDGEIIIKTGGDFGQHKYKTFDEMIIDTIEKCKERYCN